jgi:tetratricopeptide (TPR) repeat protein
MPWKPSNQPVRYDRARVHQLDTFNTAIEKLGLPVHRFRKIGAIRNALEVQIEDGGDNPEVNRFLLEALRAAILHQVGEPEAQSALHALAEFEQAESQRWEQLKAGTLLPMALTSDERLDDLMQEGYQLLQARQTAEVCDKWLQAWEIIKQIATPRMQDVREFDAAHPLAQLVFNWCQDLEMELQNAAAFNSNYHKHRLRYAREFMTRFPQMDPLHYLNFTRAQGEALWELHRHDEAEKVFAALVERMSDDAWAYIGWSDIYWLLKGASKDFAQAETILKCALARPRLRDRVDVLERLADLYKEWGKPDQRKQMSAQAERLRSEQQSIAPRAARQSESPNKPALPARKPGRNDPCWCGSGKKYKHCHMSSDR